MKLFKTFVLGNLLLSTALSAQNQVSFLEFIELAKKNDPNLAAITADEKRTEFLTELGLPARSLLLQASRQYGISTTDKQNTTSTNVDISRSFLTTGTTLSASYTKSDLADRTEEVQQFRLEQSLFRNLFGKYGRLQESALKDEVKSLEMQIAETYEDYMQDLGALYLDYAQAWHNVELAKVILQETKNLLSNVTKMKSNSIASKTDVERAKLQVSLREEDLTTQKNQMAALQARMEAITGIDGDFTPDLDTFKVMLSKVRETGVEPEDLRVSKIAIYNEKNATKNLKLANSLSRPNVSIIAGYNIDQSSRFGTAVNREEQVLGLELSMPFGDTQNQALQKEASLNKLKSGISKRAQQVDNKRAFKTLKNNLISSKSVMKLNLQKVELSEKVYAGDLKRYQYGQLSLDRLIEAKNDFSLYRYQLFASAASYYKAALDWLSFSDDLVEEVK